MTKNKLKINIVNSSKFHLETLNFYREFCIEIPFEEADFIITTAFDPIKITGDKKVYVCSNTTGIEHLDITEAPNAKIVSLRGLDLSEFTAVPELCIGMAIYLTRLFKKEEIKGKTLGIIGYGRIGKQLADYATVMGMRVIALDKEGVQDTDKLLPELLKKSDIVSLHITADEENRNFIDFKKIEMMKDGAILLNSARPWLVDYKALSIALHSMKLAGAWFDFEVEDMFRHARMYTTPHLGGTTKESTKRSEMLIAERSRRKVRY